MLIFDLSPQEQLKARTITVDQVQLERTIIALSIILKKSVKPASNQNLA
ncbi:MAG: hypothetical protein LC437_08480 [Thiohalomonas sp.]|nr:hypothetical protein [Thiohalomonas sp.]